MTDAMAADGVYGYVIDQYYPRCEIDDKMQRLEGRMKYEDTLSRAMIMEDIETILHGFSDRLRELILERTNIEIPVEDFNDIIAWSMEDPFK